MKPYRIVLDSRRKNVIIVETEHATEELAQGFSDWVRENKLGTRIAFLMWRMHSEEAVTLFLMRWS